MNRGYIYIIFIILISEITLKGIIEKEREVTIDIDIPCILPDGNIEDCGNTIKVIVSPDTKPNSFIIPEFIISFIIGLILYVFVSKYFFDYYFEWRSFTSFFIGKIGLL